MRTKAKYQFAGFVRPDCYWPYPYTIEQAFGVFRWMVETGLRYRDKTDWGHQTILSLLSCKPSCVNFSNVDPIRSIEDLRRRFHYAILSDHVGPKLRRWREEHRVFVGGEAIVPFQHHLYGKLPESEHASKQGIDALLGCQGRLAVQLNKYHDKAREIYGVGLHLDSFYQKPRWRFELNYGYEGSVWHHTLAIQVRDEPFLRTFKRAKTEMGRLVFTEAPNAKETA